MIIKDHNINKRSIAVLLFGSMICQCYQDRKRRAPFDVSATDLNKILCRILLSILLQH